MTEDIQKLQWMQDNSCGAQPAQFTVLSNSGPPPLQASSTLQSLDYPKSPHRFLKRPLGELVLMTSPELNQGSGGGITIRQSRTWTSALKDLRTGGELPNIRALVHCRGSDGGVADDDAWGWRVVCWLAGVFICSIYQMSSHLYFCLSQRIFNFKKKMLYVFWQFCPDFYFLWEEVLTSSDLCAINECPFGSF